MLDKIKYLINKVGRTYGQELYQKMCTGLCEIIECDYVFIAKLHPEQAISQVLAVSAHGKLVDNFSYELKDTPCEEVSKNQTCSYLSNVIKHFPKDELLIQRNVQAYIGTPLYDSKGQVQGLLVVLNSKPIENQSDILILFELASNRIAVELERTKHENENLRLLNTDLLTGLASKSALLKKLTTPGEKSLLLIAINNFAVFNEAYGFSQGDQIIRKTVELLKNTFKADCYASIGPTKFALLYNERQSLDKEIHAISHFFDKHEIQTDEISTYLSFSFGGVIGENDLLRTASAALRQSKLSGSSTQVIIDHRQGGKDFSRHQSFIEANNIVHAALENDMIIPYFQGIRDNSIGQINKYETLARIHYKGKVLTPYSFIEAAKLSGLLPQLTRRIITKAFAVMANYNHHFSINISEEDLSVNYLLNLLIEQSRINKIDPKRVTLEILENVSSSAKEGHIQQIKSLKNAGFNISIDDFGAEYSNFERILDLDVDFIKIDAKYIKNIDTHQQSYEIVKAIAYFCRNSGIDSIAEYVHCAEVQKVIHSLGINYSQGFLFSEPKPFDSKIQLGQVKVYFDDTITDLVHMKLTGHYTSEHNSRTQFIKITETLSENQTINVIYDSTDSDFFQVSYEQMEEVGQLDANAYCYSQVRLVALIANDEYSKLMCKTWIDATEKYNAPYHSEIFEDMDKAIAWIKNFH